jgi:hypothetical protein
MTKQEQMNYVNTLNMLFVNKVITREEFRSALKTTTLFGKVCSKK